MAALHLDYEALYVMSSELFEPRDPADMDFLSSFMQDPLLLDDFFGTDEPPYFDAARPDPSTQTLDAAGNQCPSLSPPDSSSTPEWLEPTLTELDSLQRIQSGPVPCDVPTANNVAGPSKPDTAGINATMIPSSLDCGLEVLNSDYTYLAWEEDFTFWYPNVPDTLEHQKDPTGLDWNAYSLSNELHSTMASVNGSRIDESMNSTIKIREAKSDTFSSREDPLSTFPNAKKKSTALPSEGPGIKRAALKRKRAAGASRNEERLGVPLINRYCFHQMADPNSPTKQEFLRFSGENSERRKALAKAGGTCIRCQMMKKKCEGGSPCDRCLEFWNANYMSRTIIWSDCVRSRLRDLLPFEQRKDHTKVWSDLIEGNHYYNLFQSKKASGMLQKGQHIRDAAGEGHCTFTDRSHGLTLYYAILALLVDYEGCKYSFKAVIDTAGTRALLALDSLLAPRDFEKREPKEKCGLLVCLFYALISLERLKSRSEIALTSRFQFEEYKGLKINLARLQAAQRIIAHFFAITCERLDVAGEEWYGLGEQGESTHGLKYVLGMCKFVSLFELEQDLAAINKLLGSLPIIADKISDKRRRRSLTSEGASSPRSNASRSD